MSNLSAEVRSEISFLREIQYDLAIQDLKCGASDEAKQLRSKVIARMALLAPYVAKAAKIATHVAALVAVLIIRASNAVAQDVPHQHPPADMPIHEKFYSTWYMPDQPTKSCCNKMDCYPTEVRMSGGRIQAKRREDGKWLTIPEAKIERNRDNPDGRNHLCAPVPSIAYPPDTVFCFTLGTGG